MMFINEDLQCSCSNVGSKYLEYIYIFRIRNTLMRIFEQ
jgi:hypothetical protein